jgi:hypothetical protein
MLRLAASGLEFIRAEREPVNTGKSFHLDILDIEYLFLIP